MSIRLEKAALGQLSRDRATVILSMDEQDVAYLLQIMEEEQIRDPRDGAPPDYIKTLQEAQARLADERRSRDEGPGLLVRLVRT